MRYDKELTENVMIRQKILQQLLEWIECNLEHPISIEDIAQKSGYSRRNIQLL
ncbi:AraC family transcriptional regulator, partial [Salmonella enterica subsp. enterica serovar Oranienburg]|nr:AraC family transcriptional regulator [Salmonella enterica subsp. enterica serovar Oranienburg]